MSLTRVADKQLANTSADETEPAIITYRQFGVDYSCSVWMNFSPNLQSSTARLYATSWSSTGNSNTAAIPLLDNDPNIAYADPVLVKDPTQNRIFLVAVAIKTENSTTKVYTVLTWASTNGGWTWSLTPQVVAQARVVQGAGTPKLDKPEATVGPDGKLWVAWVRHLRDLRMRSATISGSTWTWSPAVDSDPNNGIPYDDPGILISSGFLQPSINAHNPQIMGDFNSVAYILFTDFDNTGGNNWGRIGLIKYDANANPQFVSLANATNNTSVPTLYTGKGGDDWLTLTASVRLRAGTVPSAKYDRTRGRISVTWHERNPNGGAGSRVQFATYKISTGSWSTATVATSGHNLLPAMDFDPANGNHMVTWYAVGSGASTYTHAGSYVTFSGDTPIPGTQDSITNQTGADMFYLTLLSPGSTDRIVGDYHEVSFTNGAFKAAHIHAVSGGSNPWSFTVSP
jgi:hypothetical protein